MSKNEFTTDKKYMWVLFLIALTLLLIGEDLLNLL